LSTSGVFYFTLKFRPFVHRSADHGTRSGEV
jgi:hypothetical protein